MTTGLKQKDTTKKVKIGVETKITTYTINIGKKLQQNHSIFRDVKIRHIRQAGQLV